MNRAPPVSVVPSSYGAWMAVMVSALFVALANWMAFAVRGDENIKWWGTLIAIVIAFGPPVAGIVMGLRVGRLGNSAGPVAAAGAGVWLLSVGLFTVLANFFIEGVLGQPWVAALLALALVAGIAEIWRLVSGKPHPWIRKSHSSGT